MLSVKLFFIGLLVCGALAVEGGSRVLRLTARRSASEARNTAFSSAPQLPTTTASARRMEETVEVPELNSRRASSLPRPREGARLSSLLSRGNVDSLPITRNTSGSGVNLLSVDPSRSIKSRSIDEKNLVTGLRKSKPNATFTPELNSLDASEKIEKLITRGEKVRNREHVKHFGRFRTRRVTKELREFWEILDQRELSTQIDKRKNVTDNHATNSSLDSNSPRTLPGTNETEVNETEFEEFPFLSENYDYNYYYYDDEAMHSNFSSQASPGSQTNIMNNAMTVPSELLVQEHSVINPETLTDNSTQKLNSTSDADATTMSQSRDSLSKMPSDNILLVSKIQARMMPELTAQGSRRVTQISALPLPIPVTASDSFRNRRQNDNERDANGPRDILKEFPIFRQLNKNQTVEENKRKTLSLHERLLHLTSRQSFVATIINSPITTETIATATETSTFTTTSSAIQSTMPLSTTTTRTNIELITMSQEIPRTRSVQREPLEIRLIDADQSTNLNLRKQADVTLQNSTNSPNSTQQVHMNVTFSTSKTHKIAQTSPSFAIGTPQVFESQLGIAPLGETPFGLAPFGEIPMGEKPFGLLPQGISPLGNVTSDEVNATDPNATPAEGVDGRFHVQVTGPDGSINGDYIVVDPVTGDVNGVRYEAAHDVDPLLVQRALLNFLSLDPRLSPIGTSTVNVEESLDGSTNPPDTTEVDVVFGAGGAKVEAQLEITSQTEIDLETGPSEIIETASVDPLPAQSDLLITEMPEATITPDAPPIAEPTEPPEFTLVLTE